MNLRKTVTAAWVSALLLPLLLSCVQPETHIKRDNGYRNRSPNNPKTTVSTIHHSGLPKVDEILFKAYPGAPPDVIVDEFIEGVTDWIEGPHRIDLYNKVLGNNTYGTIHKVSQMDPLPEFTFITINCRDYKGTSGEPNLPLNDSNFRIALSYIYGMDNKPADIFDSSYRFEVEWKYAIGNPVPAAQEPWYNASIQMPDTNWTKAWSILQTAGYYINSTENWLYRNGIKMRNLTTLYSSGSPYGARPWRGFIQAFNNFTTTHLGANGPTMVLLNDDFGGMITDLLLFRDFDFIAIGLTNLGRYVDWLYDCLHSDNDVPWGWNFGGIHDPDFDMWTETILTSLDIQEVIDAASKVQEKFVYELLPWIPMSSGKEFCTTVRDDRGELMNIVSMPYFGPRNDWSYMTIHWKGEPDVAWPGGTVNVTLEDEPYSLNPLTEPKGSGWEILDRSIIGLTIVEPRNLMNMPFVATDWEVAYWTSIPELGIVNGCRCTFWLRQDVTWHDGRPVTAYDCVRNLRFWREVHPGSRSDPMGLVYEEADGPYKFNVYLARPGLYYADFVARKALLTPKHILDKIDWSTWEPSDNNYEDLGLGPPPTEYSFLKQLVGCGPFVFDYYNRSQAEGRVERYQDFFINAPVVGSVAGGWRIDPFATYEYKVLVQNMAAMEADENGTFTDVTVDVKIIEDDVLTYEVDNLHIELWNWTYLGPYTMENVTGGLHTIRVEVLDHNASSLIHNYTHTFAATIREDITTYSGEQLDFTVNMRDIGRVARAFGSYASGARTHPRWDPICDINDDLKVDMRDVGAVARRFGWICDGY